MISLYIKGSYLHLDFIKTEPYELYLLDLFEPVWHWPMFTEEAGPVVMMMVDLQTDIMVISIMVGRKYLIDTWLSNNVRAYF